MYKNQTRNFAYNFLSQNVLIPPNCILPTHFCNFSIKIGSIYFFSSSDTDQSHYLLGFHTTRINSSFNSFFKFFTFSKFNMLEKEISPD